MIVLSETTRLEMFREMTEHLLTDDKPSYYMNTLSKDAAYKGFPYLLLWKLKDTEQSPKYHPEGNVWNHTMLVLDEAAAVREQTKEKKEFMWAALLHDIGKPTTTRMRKGKTTSYDHDKEGEKLSTDFLSYFIDDEDFISKVSALVRYHMHILYVLKKLPYGDIKGMLKRVDKNDLALLCRCDRLGRGGVDKKAEEVQYLEFKNILDKLI